MRSAFPPLCSPVWVGSPHPPRRKIKPSGQKDAASITAPISGTLQAFKIADGADVAAGELIAVMEAMKMETQVVAARRGKLRFTAEAGSYLEAGGRDRPLRGGASNRRLVRGVNRPSAVGLRRRMEGLRAGCRRLATGRRPFADQNGRPT